MKVVRLALFTLALGSLLMVGACSRKTRTKKHAQIEGESAASLVPTPDTTPIEALRTPAGLVLKAGPEPTATPSPEAASAPASSKAGL